MKFLHSLTFILLVVGGLNWLLVGLFGWDVSRWLGGTGAIVPKVIYILVGLSAIYQAATHGSSCKMCAKQPSQASSPSPAAM